MELSQRIINHIAKSRKTPDADVLVEVVVMCMADRKAQSSATEWVPFNLDLVRKGARVQFRDGSTGSIEEILDLDDWRYPITAFRSVCGAEMTYTIKGEHYKSCEDDFDIVMIEVGSEK